MNGTALPGPLAPAKSVQVTRTRKRLGSPEPPARQSVLASATHGAQVMSSSEIVTVEVGMLPIEAPPVGAESVAVKVSLGSSTASSSSRTSIVLLAVSPLPQERMPFEIAW